MEEDLDLDRLLGFDWDAGNLNKNATKHAVTPRETEEVFQGRVVIAFDETHSRYEPRWRALGRTQEGRLLHVTFTVRRELIRVISARPMLRKERLVHATPKQK